MKNNKELQAAIPTFPFQPRTFAEKITVETGNYRTTGGDRVPCRTSAYKVFERQPGHALEYPWALYANLNRLEKAVLSERCLPKLTVEVSRMDWISEFGTTTWEEKFVGLPEMYLFWFSLALEVGEDPLGTDEKKFAPWGVRCDRGPSDENGLVLEFFHQAPAPVLPWPHAYVRALEIPGDLEAAVFEGLRQAEEALLVALGMRNPAITALMA